MKKVIKIALFPTQFMKKFCSRAVGTATIHTSTSKDQNYLSINLFNFPKPNQFSKENKKCTCYKGWVFNPTSGQVILLGTFTTSGDQLYLLYDIPIKRQDEFSEIIVTADINSSSSSSPEQILMLGYLSNMETKHLESFQPFSPQLPDHKWWKMKKTQDNPNHSQKMNTCNFCPYCRPMPTNYYLQSPSQPSTSHNKYGLPQILGLKVNQSGNIEYLVHGIPGRLLRSEQPNQGKSGYLNWQPYYGFEKEIGALGYWLCYIDPITNQIATPMGVNIPPG